MNENQKKVTEEYRQNYDQIFSKKTWVCRRCAQTVPNDVAHNCPNWLAAVDEDEARYNSTMGRSGVRWAGD